MRADARRTSVVAGGSGVLGAQVVQRLVDAGDRVVVLDRVAPDVTGDAVSHLRVDLTDESEVTAALGEVCAGCSAPRALVNCQGWSPKNPDGTPVVEEDLSAKLFLSVLEVNLLSCFLTLRFVVPVMAAAGGGRVVNVSSTSGLTGRTTASPAYAAAKAGLDALTRNFAVRYADRGVLVCSVAPGKFTNPTWPHNAEQLDGYRREIPLGRLALPGEVADLVAFLASENNTYLTGQTLVIDGGRLA
jgi:NAD(P)-dependent dehydrogenase (short-subunit alcohol dehydrogenase family)